MKLLCPSLIPPDRRLDRFRALAPSDEPRASWPVPSKYSLRRGAGLDYCNR
jgi:hypothetical protein